MDVEDKTEGLRVTRARTRRLSTIDLTDSRPSTPLLDIAPDRGSPRPTRRALINNMDSGTPIRTTRRSVARGETPEPLTPSMSAAKRSATKRERPAGVKAARKQLLGETINISEDSVDIKMEPLAEVVESAAESNDAASVSPTNSITEKRVTRSMSNSPPFAKNATSKELKEQPESTIEGSISSEQKSLDIEIEKAVQATKDKLLNEKDSGTKPEIGKTGDNVSEMTAKENSDVHSNKTQNLSIVIKRSKAPNVQKSELVSAEKNEEIKKPVNIEVAKKETHQKAAIDLTEENPNIPNLKMDKNNEMVFEVNSTEDVETDLELNKSESIKETKKSDLTETSVERSTDSTTQISPKETGVQEHDSTQREDTSEKIVVSKEESPEKIKISNTESPQKVYIQNSVEGVNATEVVDKGSERINTESSLDTTQKEASTESPQKVYIRNSEEVVNATEAVNKGSERMSTESSLDTTQKEATLEKVDVSMEENPESFKVSSTESPQKVSIQNSEEGINSSEAVDKRLESIKSESEQENKKSDLINTSMERLANTPKSFKEMQCETEAQHDTIQKVSATNLRDMRTSEDSLEKPQKLLVEQTVENDIHQSSEMDINIETHSVLETGEENQRKSIGGKIIKIEKLPPLTPNIRSRTISDQKQCDQSKHSVVAFTDSGEDEKKVKRAYPKTPTRMKPTPKQLKNPGTPSLPGLPKTQKSSTPLNTKVTVETKPTPSFIDGIKPFAETSFKNVSSQHELPKRVTRKELSMRLISDNEDEDDEEIDEEDMSEFVQHEVEVAENYISGESMDSEMRMEMQQNEIPVDGESLCSEDTSENEISEDEESNSFIVSDTENLVYSTDEVEEGEIINTSVKRKYRRIVDQEEDEEEEAEKEPMEYLNSSKLSEAAQLFYESVEKIMDSAMKETNSEEHELNETDRLNKTATRLQVSEDDHEGGNDQHSEEEENSDNNVNLMCYEEDDSVDELEPEKSLVKCSASIYEVLDSNDENHSPVMFKGKLKDKKVNSSCIDTTDSPIKDKSVMEEKDSSIKSTEAFHKKQKCEEEKALLDEISATDLTHLKQLFNPLQKSRRQTLYMNSPEEILKKPKLKRRSELLNSNDFNPSQSFIESITEIKSQHAKRKRLSKSFSCVTEELDEEPGAVKKTKMHTEQKAASENKEEKQAIESEDEEEVVAKPNEHQHEHNDTKMLEESKPTENEQKYFKDHSAEQTKPTSKEAKKTHEEKNISDAANKLSQNDTKQESGCMNDAFDMHMKYCESLIQAANLAKLEQKKQQIALGKKKKRSLDKDEVAVPKSTAAIAAVPKSTTAIAAAKKCDTIMDKRNIDSVKTTKLKKNVKRLQAVQQAAKHAIQLLAPDLADIQAKSLQRKLSPQPPAGTNAAKRVKRKEKRMNLHTSPAKSSDEENRSQVVNLIKTSAGYVTESMDDGEPKKNKIIEFIKCSSGIMRVEACSPEPKYFRELPSTPTNLYGFRMEPKASKTVKVKRKATNGGTQKCNYATESAMRFKNEVFTRKK